MGLITSGPLVPLSVGARSSPRWLGGSGCDTAAAAAPGPSGEERTGRRSGEEEEEEEHAGMDAPVAVAVPPQPQPQPQPQPPPAPAAAPPYRWSRAVARSPAAWMRLGVGGLLVGSIIFAFYEWGLPLLSEKVLLPIMRWEARSFGRHLLAIVLIASLAIFPVVLLPSSPSMWLTGIIFGYGFGFLIIMVGTAIGMSIPYFIGSLFRERLHEWLEKKWPREIALVKLASKGSWFKQFRVIVLLRISPFPYSMLNYTVTVTQIKYGPYICGSVVGMVPDALVNIYSGRLILTLAGLKYHNHRLTTVEIVYNVISISVAFLVAIGFTVYAKRALDEMERSEGTCPEPAGIAHGSTELRAHHQECSNSSSVPIDVVYTVYSDDSLARHVLDLLPESLHGFGYNGEK
uniref:VTT domain-containing protein n=1 Tax=Oryza nivara TaxID=4536 RepID=A0A0E0I4K0_ORYNI